MIRGIDKPLQTDELARLRQRVAGEADGPSLQKLVDALGASELRYRRLFESAKEGILILDADTGEVCDVNPFLAELLGYSAQEIIGTKLWELGPFRDVPHSKIAFQELQSKEYIRYEDLPLQTRDGRSIAVEFVSNVYLAGDKRVVQCNIRDITARKRGDELVQRLVRAVEQVKNAIFMTGPDGAITYVNPAFEQLYGYSQLETLGKTPRILRSGQQDQAVYERFWQRLFADESVRQEFVNKTKDGRLVTVENTVSSIFDAEGRRVGFIAVQDDVTQHKRAERALQLSERRFRALAESGLDFISLLAADGTLLWESPGAIHPLGYPPDAFLGHSLFELVHPDDADRIRHALAEVVQEPANPQQGVFRLRRSDGSWCWVEASAANRLHDESVQAIVINYRDITERKLTEAALRQSELLASSLVEHLPQRIFVKDRNSTYLFCNASYAQSLGIEPRQIVGKDDFAFFRTELAEAYRSDDRQVLANGKIKDSEERFTTGEEERWVHTFKIPYRNEQGESLVSRLSDS
jgi:PAS domain S-box-containing protein